MPIVTKSPTAIAQISNNQAGAIPQADWSNLSNAIAFDGDDASALIGPVNPGRLFSRTIAATDFEFGIPGDATDIMVEVRVARWAGFNPVKDHWARLRNVSGAPLIENPSPWLGEGDEMIYTHSQLTNDGAVALTPEIVNDPLFGFHLAAAQYTSGVNVARVDGIEMSVTYDEGVPTDTTNPSVSIESPSPFSQWAVGEGVPLLGIATDDFDGDISNNISWSSNQDGALGTGNRLWPKTMTTLGAHQIQASVDDKAGNTGTAQVNIIIIATPSGREIDFYRHPIHSIHPDHRRGK